MKNFLIILLYCVWIIIGVGFLRLKDTGAFINWELLESNNKFVTIEEVTSHSVWARASDGNLYFWEFSCNENIACNKWTKTEQIPSNLHELTNNESPMRKDKTCPDFGFTQKELPQKLVECAVGLYQSSGAWGRYYVLLEDGTIWSWKMPAGHDFPNYAPLMAFIILSTIFFITFAYFYNLKNEEK